MLDHGAEAAPELVECDPKPLCVDLFCGLGGWAEGFLAEGYDVVGFDIEARPYPGSLALQDVLTIHGSQFKTAACLVASPPCQEYSYMAMPWSRAKQIAGALRASNGRGSRHDSECCFPAEYSGSRNLIDLTALFHACFRIQREASEAAGHHIPLVVENVKGAQPWVGRARANFGSFYLWGDVDSIGGRIVKRNDIRWGAPSVKAAACGAKNGHIGGGSWFAIGSPGQENVGQNPDGRKVSGLNWSGSDKPGYVAQAFNTTAEQRFRDGQKVPGFNFHEHEKTGQPGRSFQSAAVSSCATHQDEGLKGLEGRSWIRNPECDPRPSHGNSPARKAASAQIAKIPFALAVHIARIYKPDTRGTDRQQEACL